MSVDSLKEIERIRVSPIQWFLIRADTDDLLKFIGKMKLAMWCAPMGKGKISVSLKSEGGFLCEATGEGFKAGLTRALALFLANEARDYHEVRKVNS